MSKFSGEALLVLCAGVAESVIMSIGGWKTAAMFRRYAIVSHSDQKVAVSET